jgi:hypothetical protein
MCQINKAGKEILTWNSIGKGMELLHLNEIEVQRSAGGRRKEMERLLILKTDFSEMKQQIHSCSYASHSC